ncbi:MAG: methanogenesis marker 8 protein [Euryarchaeota archaeon]|nr:methanogenesis marker 8 protein [Euryarchaeota archaeon]
MSRDRHVLETLGKARVVIEDGKVVEVGKPQLSYCPLWEKMRGIKALNERVIKENVEFRIRDFGLCTPDRELELEVFVGFGTSETFMTALRRGLLDAVVTVCEGAGTVVTSNPALVQGIGARLSGVIETTPVEGILKRVKAKGGVILDPPRIDQEAGLQMAIRLGYKRVGVTVATLEDAQKCRAVSAHAVIFGVHLTGISRKDAEAFIELTDLVTSCASEPIRALAGEKALLQAGTAIPIFALTTAGKELLLERAKEVKSTLLLSNMRLPVLPKARQPEPTI